MAVMRRINDKMMSKIIGNIGDIVVLVRAGIIPRSAARTPAYGRLLASVVQAREMRHNLHYQAR